MSRDTSTARRNRPARCLNRSHVAPESRWGAKRPILIKLSRELAMGREAFLLHLLNTPAAGNPKAPQLRFVDHRTSRVQVLDGVQITRRLRV